VQRKNIEGGGMDADYLSLNGGEYLYMCHFNQVINANLKDIFLKHGTDRKMKIHDVDIDEELLKDKIIELTTLVFEVTENCNLRCKYCIYNGSYLNERQLASHNMSFETARKAIDYVLSIINNRKKKEFYLSFYGGEPLLNLKTIKRILDYVKKQFPAWMFRYSMTTNLTLLDSAALDFLVKHNFSLLVSLDGDRDNHNAKRVFADGTGSHKTIMKNLERIKKYDRTYFDNKVRFCAVYSYDLPLKKLYHFFTTNKFVVQKSVRFSQVNLYNTSYYEVYPYNKKEFRKDFRDIFACILEKIRTGEKLSGLEAFLYNNFKGIGDTIKARDHTYLANACLFNHRLYLNARGRFHICERMNNTFSIGDVNKGFDFKKMVDIVNEFKQVVKKQCTDCNIKFLCTRCYLHFGGNGEFNLNSKFCKNQRESIISNLEKYIKYKEEGLV
jgi:uncharacterized protein